MNIICANTTTSEIRKEVFSLKPVGRDGLILQIHHTIDNCGVHSKRIRFIYSAFDNTGLILANADINGNVFMIDFSCNKFWSIPKFKTCSALAFSSLNNDELIFACCDGNLFIVNIHLGEIVVFLEGHVNAVKHISFAQEQCLTASSTQAIIFDLVTSNKIHELSLGNSTHLKQMTFMPITNNILACFSDDYIHVWKQNTFQSFKKLLPTEWHKFNIKSIAITRNGTTMAIGGLSSKLIIFSLDTWSLTKILNLSEEVYVKSSEFVSQPHDGGANRYLILLSTSGIIHLLDMEQNVVISKIQQPGEIISFTCSLNGTHLACILKSGEVYVHKLALFVEASVNEKQFCEIEATRNPKIRLFQQSHKNREELNLGKLQGILKEYGEYPEHYRGLIWTKILLLPNNMKSYQAINSKGFNPSFIHIEEKYPLESTHALKNLKKLLSNLGNWNLMFCDMEFLPLFVFPFVKVFENDPLVCFEAVVTIIINWCQHWFEYAPVSPVNILAMIENVFAEHDAQLLTFLTEHKVTSHLYAWSLLEVAFSEVLTIKEWCTLWDHILSNESAFILMIPVAYNILNRSVLATLNNLEQFNLFYHYQNPVDIKKLISKSYFLLNNTTEARHPRKYFKNFDGLPKGSYPVFNAYPKANVKINGKQNSQIANQNSIKMNGQQSSQILNQKSINMNGQQSSHILNQKSNTNINRKEGSHIKAKATNTERNLAGDNRRKSKSTSMKVPSSDECICLKPPTFGAKSGYDEEKIDGRDIIEKEIDEVQNEIENFRATEEQRQDLMIRQREESARLKKLEDIYQDQLLQEQHRQDKRKIELSKLKTRLFEMQADSMERSRREIEEINLEDRKRELDKILKQIDFLQNQEDIEVQKTEEDLSKHYVELLRQKTILENLLIETVNDDRFIPENYKLITEQRKIINNELANMRYNVNLARVNTKIKIPMGISATNDKVQKIDMALAQEMANKQQHLILCNNNLQILQMEKDTSELEKQVEFLLDHFAQVKNIQVATKLHELTESVSERQQLMQKEYELMVFKKHKDDFDFPESGGYVTCSRHSKSPVSTNRN